MVIGIFDSGLGGLSVWRELRKLHSGNFIYFGDTAHVPYGEKTSAELQCYFRQIVRFLEEKNCASVVVACNTSSVLALPQIKSEVQTQLFGIVDAALNATLAVGKGCVGVLATKATVESGVYQREFRKHKPHWNVFVRSAPKLVKLVEQGRIRDEATKEALVEYLTPLLAEKIDTLLLGCTHYPFLQPLIEEIVGPEVQIVDPAFKLAVQVQKSLNELTLKHVKYNNETEFWVSAQPEQFRMNAEMLLNEKIPSVNLHQILGERAECE